ENGIAGAAKVPKGLIEILGVKLTLSFLEPLEVVDYAFGGVGKNLHQAACMGAGHRDAPPQRAPTPSGWTTDDDRTFLENAMRTMRHSGRPFESVQNRGNLSCDVGVVGGRIQEID